MEKAFQIKGITRSEYPLMYAVLERNMKAYNITKIKVIMLEHGFQAGTRSFLGNYSQPLNLQKTNIYYKFIYASPWEMNGE
jgi:hypothetical protein